ncbi:MAG: DUF4184 family protein [Promethearchaeota archaeon]|jgi:membrane-bound metal-dependent hydrolase YbcI (DUF457 family)
MPSSVLSHQAPGLALKVKFPKRLDGTALCFGTIVPDLSVVFNWVLPINFYGISHSFIGLIVWTIPFALIATILFSKFIGPFCAKIASLNGKFIEPLRYFGVDQWKHIKNKEFNKRFWITAIYSVLIGGITHILLDWPSHEYVQLLYPWVVVPSPDFLLYSIVDYGTISIGPFLVEANLTVYNLLWSIESLIALFISLYYLRYIKKHNLIKKWYEDYNLE